MARNDIVKGAEIFLVTPFLVIEFENSLPCFGVVGLIIDASPVSDEFNRKSRFFFTRKKTRETEE